MKRALCFVALAATAAVLWAQGPAGKKTLYVYDEVNKNSAPYIELFRSGLAERGIAYDEATAAEAEKKDLAAYDRILIHGMVMAFAGKSPVRDWLKSDPALRGKEVHLFVTANRWKLEKLYGQLAKLLRKDGAVVVDAVSMATKDLDDAAKAKAVKDHVARLK